MDINLDCIRCVLKYCVDNIDYEEFGNDWQTKSVNLVMMYASSDLSSFSKKEIMRSVLKLDECGFLKISTKFPENAPYLVRCTIEDITMAGYNFIESLKEPSVWEKTKAIANKFGNHTLGFVETVAHDIAVESAKQAIAIMMLKNN